MPYSNLTPNVPMSNGSNRLEPRRFAALLTALLLSAGSAFAATDSNLGNTEEGTQVAQRSIGDANGDQMSDTFQARIETLGARARFDVIVTFDGSGNAAPARAAVGAFGPARALGLVKGFAAEMTGAQARALASTAGVFRVEENIRVQTQVAEARADYRANDAQSNGFDGGGTGICVIDTGVDGNHVDLAPRLATANAFCNVFASNGYAIDGKGNALPDANTVSFDDHSHGTHVSGIAFGAGIGNPDNIGVAPAATSPRSKEP